MPTETKYVEDIANNAHRYCVADMDTCAYATDVCEAVKYMLWEHVTVEPTDDDNDDERKVKRILCEDYLEFYLISVVWGLGGSVADYCVEHVVDALDRYAVVDIEGVDEMLEEIRPGMSHALNPDLIYEELAEIGIA